jgi:hypothetical protein
MRSLLSLLCYLWGEFVSEPMQAGADRAELKRQVERVNLFNDAIRERRPVPPHVLRSADRKP